MTDIDAIKANLLYKNKEEHDRAYASWFTIIAILADAYADSVMSKEESICRWIVRERKVPRRYSGSYCYWNWEVCHIDMVESILPLSLYELKKENLFVMDSLVGCLDRLLLVSDKYLERFV